jgi:outer membrane lipoprotein SlyB
LEVQFSNVCCFFLSNFSIEIPMFKRIVAGTVTILFTLGLTACAPTTPSAPLEIRSGVIQQITATQIANNHETGVGAVIGALGGLGVGALIGSGTGKAVAMVLGAVGGAVGGNEIQKHYDKPVAGQQIFVRTSSGVLVTVTQPTGNFHVGQKVYIEGAGTDARVVPQ